jgi:DNA (cytosine-5)-methyltransferase 1
VEAESSRSLSISGKSLRLNILYAIMSKTFPPDGGKMGTEKRTEFACLLEKSGLSIEDVATQAGYATRTVYRWKTGEVSPRKTVMNWLHNYVDTISQHGNAIQPSFRFIDLFAGIGGLRMGFESAGGHCVFTSEWNTESRKTYQANFSCDHPVEGDITEIPENEIPEHDVLVAGFPCQPFSIAGVSKKNALGRPHGFLCESQGTLFFDVARIIAHHKPAVFLLENVKNLVNHDKGNTFEVIRKTLKDELGYYIDWRVINAKGFVPQNRERIFIAGFRTDTGFKFKNLGIPDPDKGPSLKTVLHPEDGTEPEESPFTNGSKGKVNEKYTLSEKLWTYLKNYAEKHRLKGNGFGYGLVGPEDTARTLSARYYKDGSEILIRQKGGRPRRLTPRECARLMGFDRPGHKPFVIPVSDTQAYKQFGNAVVVPVVEAVAKFMLPHIIEVLDSNNSEARKPKNASAIPEQLTQHV